MTLGKNATVSYTTLCYFVVTFNRKKTTKYRKGYGELSNPKRHHAIGRCGMNHARLLRITNL